MLSKESKQIPAHFIKSYIEPLCGLRDKDNKEYPVMKIRFKLVDSDFYNTNFEESQTRDSCLLIPQTTPDGIRRVFFINNDAQGNLSEFISASIDKTERQFFLNINKQHNIPLHVLYDEGEYFDFTSKIGVLHSRGQIYTQLYNDNLGIAFRNHSLDTLYYPFDNNIKNLLKSGERLLNDKTNGRKKTRQEIIKI